MIILNADDFGLSDEVSRGILHLVDRQMLSAYSIMVNMPFAKQYSQQVIDSRRIASVGLHLNLTEGTPLTQTYSMKHNDTFVTLGKVMQHCLLRTADKASLRDEIRAQFDMFEKNYACQPDHVDGHQHAHMLPIIRDIVLDEIQTRYPQTPPMIRQSVSTHSMLMRDGLVNGFKSLTVALVGLGFVSALESRGIPKNDTFAGFSTFSNSIAYETELKRWLETSNGVKLVMCHPGYEADRHSSDVLAHRRHQEFHAIESMPNLDEQLWRPSRTNPKVPINWSLVR